MNYTPCKRKAYYYETDRMDIVHHSNYVRWLEEARVDLMSQMGYDFVEMEKLGVVSPVLSVETHYKFPVKFGEEFEVRCKVTKFNGCQFELDYEIFNLTTQKISCLAHSSHCFTTADLKPIRLQKKFPDIYEKFSQAITAKDNMYLKYGEPNDIDNWIKLVTEVHQIFPGLETEDKIAGHRDTVLKFMTRKEAICVKDNDNIAGVLLFSKKHNMICCLAVSPQYRRRGIAKMLMTEALKNLSRDKDITVSTFRENDPNGAAPRALYKKFGFEEGELIEEFGYPNQVFILRSQKL